MVKIDFVVGKFLHEDVTNTVVFEDAEYLHEHTLGSSKAHKKNYKHINRKHSTDNKQDK